MIFQSRSLLRSTIKLSLFLIALGLSVASCSKSENYSEITQIKYGKSFGECLGYCNHNLTLKSGSIEYQKSGWDERVLTFTINNILSESKWDSLKGSINVKSFLKLAPTIGCPDCADGGAEWIELELVNGIKHRVTFEYNNEPLEVKGYINILRGLMSDFNNTDN